MFKKSVKMVLSKITLHKSRKNAIKRVICNQSVVGSTCNFTKMNHAPFWLFDSSSQCLNVLVEVALQSKNLSCNKRQLDQNGTVNKVLN